MAAENSINKKEQTKALRNNPRGKPRGDTLREDINTMRLIRGILYEGGDVMVKLKRDGGLKLYKVEETLTQE